MRISITEATDILTRVMRKLGHAEEDLHPIVDHLIDCELRGLGYGGLARAVAIAVIVGAVAISGLYFYLEWQRANDEVQVRVVNSRTGAYQSYLARKVDVGARRFITLDGRQITIADVERLEIVDQP